MTAMSMSNSKRPASDAFEHYSIASHQSILFDMPYFQQTYACWPYYGQTSLPMTTFDPSGSASLAFANPHKRQKRDNDSNYTNPLATDPLSYSSSFSGSVSGQNTPLEPGVYPHPISQPPLIIAQHVYDSPPSVLIFSGHPFTEIAAQRHKSLRKLKSFQENSGSYIKMYAAWKTEFGKAALHPPKLAPKHVRQVMQLPQHTIDHSSIVQSTSSRIPLSPPDFGSAQSLDKKDKLLRNFYTDCMCPGRTLLPATNGWLNQLLPMADADPVVLHALLAFSAGYCFEYVPNGELLLRANEHYKRASELLAERLAAGITSGYEDSIIGALRLMWCDDIVQWELRRPKGHTPRWFEAAQLAKQIMKTTDSGYRYWHIEKRQCSPARVSNANMLALIDIVATTVSPLKSEDEFTEPPHPWLLAGDARDASRIHGGTGLSPKLLHMIAQITHICAVMSQDPESIVMPLAAKNIVDRLLHLSQWSELSPDAFGRHITTPELLHACRLDENGLAMSSVDVTDLTAQAWLEAARLYLRLRFYRLPRQHPDVRQPFQALGAILRRLPCSGSLFTSQSPFYPVFLYGIAAVTDNDRFVARHWFETVVERATSRSSVPPVWRVLQRAWTILDTANDFSADPEVDGKAIGKRRAWWERLVQIWSDEEGMLCIV